jgi:hypothetical protein
MRVPPLSARRSRPLAIFQSLFEAYEVENQRHFAHQVQHGLLRLNSQGDTYLITDKALERGIRNFFNPFARRLTLANALLSLLVAAVIPLVGILKLAPAVAEGFGSDAIAGLGPVGFTISTCYAVTGLILGLFSEVQSYFWLIFNDLYSCSSSCGILAGNATAQHHSLLRLLFRLACTGRAPACPAILTGCRVHYDRKAGP